ncbi:MAG: IclR family transcriptional regulator [Haloarculaceae archaeon]
MTDNTIDATKTSFEILEHLKENDGNTITGIARALNLPKSTVHNHVSTLQTCGYTINVDGEIQPSLKFLDFGQYRRRQLDISNVAKSEIDQLAADTGEQADLAVEEHGKCVYLYIAHGENAIKLNTYTGQQFYLHATGLGKAMLAYLPDEAVSRIIDRHGLPRMTDNTITDERQLRDELEEVKERGFAYNVEENTDQICCIAAPILDDSETVHGAISVSTPAQRFHSSGKEEDIKDAVLNAANIIELKLKHG